MTDLAVALLKWREWNGGGPGGRRRRVNKERKKKPLLGGWPLSWLPLCDAKVAGVAMVAIVVAES